MGEEVKGFSIEHLTSGGGDMTRSMRLLAAILPAVLSPVLASPALANQLCDPLDVTCVVTDATASGQETVKDAIDTVTGTAKPIVDDPRGAVDKILNPDDIGLPGDGTGGGGDPPGGGGPPGGGRLDGGHDIHRPPGGSHAGQGPRFQPSAGPRAAHPRSAGSSFEPLPNPIAPTKEPIFQDQVAEAVHLVAQSLGVVLALLALAAGFVMVQNRLDRRDPKLALAPVETEMMGFS
jgi:hypothetical protein